MQPEKWGKRIGQILQRAKAPWSAESRNCQVETSDQITLSHYSNAPTGQHQHREAWDVSTGQSDRVTQQKILEGAELLFGTCKAYFSWRDKSNDDWPSY